MSNLSITSNKEAEFHKQTEFINLKAERFNSQSSIGYNSPIQMRKSQSAKRDRDRNSNFHRTKTYKSEVNTKGILKRSRTTVTNRSHKKKVRFDLSSNRGRPLNFEIFLSLLALVLCKFLSTISFSKFSPFSLLRMKALFVFAQKGEFSERRTRRCFLLESLLDIFVLGHLDYKGKTLISFKNSHFLKTFYTVFFYLFL